jgi:hypothetical protein
MLMGSCGMAGKDAKLGQWFVIDNAYQADRGFLDEHNCFLGRKDKIPQCGYNMRSSVDFLVKNGFDSAEIASSNFLNQCSYNEGTPARLFDMETYYFYSVCKQLGIQSYVALRYTTDLVMEPVVIKTEMIQKTEVIKILASIKESLTLDDVIIDDTLKIIDGTSVLNEQIKPLSEKIVERKEDRKLKRELKGIVYNSFFEVFAKADCLFWNEANLHSNSIDCKDELKKIRVKGVTEALKNAEKIPTEDRSDQSKKNIERAKKWLEQMKINPHINMKFAATRRERLSPKESSVVGSDDSLIDDYWIDEFICGMNNPEHMQGNGDDSSSLKLIGISKSPVIDALVYCALMGYGVRLVTDIPDLIEFQIDDFTLYFNKSNDVFPKHYPGENVCDRIRVLRRWFPNFPSSKELALGERCIISVSNKQNKVTFAKLQAILQCQRQKAEVIQASTCVGQQETDPNK